MLLVLGQQKPREKDEGCDNPVTRDGFHEQFVYDVLHHFYMTWHEQNFPLYTLSKFLKQTSVWGKLVPVMLLGVVYLPLQLQSCRFVVVGYRLDSNFKRVGECATVLSESRRKQFLDQPSPWKRTVSPPSKNYQKGTANVSKPPFFQGALAVRSVKKRPRKKHYTPSQYLAVGLLTAGAG